VFIFPYQEDGVMDTGNYRNRVLTLPAEKLGILKLNFQILCRTMVTRAQKMGIFRRTCDTPRPIPQPRIYAELLESVKQMVSSAYAMLSI
jgi:hypothetical protein